MRLPGLNQPNQTKKSPSKDLGGSCEVFLILVCSRVLSLQFGKVLWENPIHCIPEESLNWQELYRVAQDGLPWHILATDATVDWEDMAGLKIKQTGKKNLNCVSRSSADLSTLPCLCYGDSTGSLLPCKERIQYI